MFKVFNRKSVSSIRKMPEVYLGARRLAADAPALIVAEIGNNHCGDVERALAMIEAAAEAGADAVKFQKRSPKDLLTREGFERPYRNRGNSFGPTYGKHREALELGTEAFRDLKEAAQELGLLFLASAWDLPSLEALAFLDVPAFKIASPDLTNLPLVEMAASFGSPVLMSTGMSRLDEVDKAVSVLLERDVPLVLFHCMSIYPTPPDQARLATLTELGVRYGVPVGYSGHEMETPIAVAARSLGACVIEKHFTLDRSWKGGDQKISLTPDEFARMSEEVRMVESALRGTRTGVVDGEDLQREKLGKSLVAARPIRIGEILMEDMLVCKSPALGISPLQLPSLIGRRVIQEIAPDTYLAEHHLESGAAK
jgi:sialic acid synthase SpsE